MLDYRFDRFTWVLGIAGVCLALIAPITNLFVEYPGEIVIFAVAFLFEPVVCSLLFRYPLHSLFSSSERTDSAVWISAVLFAIYTFVGFLIMTNRFPDIYGYEFDPTDQAVNAFILGIFGFWFARGYQEYANHGDRGFTSFMVSTGRHMLFNFCRMFLLVGAVLLVGLFS